MFRPSFWRLGLLFLRQRDLVRLGFGFRFGLGLRFLLGLGLGLCRVLAGYGDGAGRLFRRGGLRCGLCRHGLALRPEHGRSHPVAARSAHVHADLHHGLIKLHGRGTRPQENQQRQSEVQEDGKEITAKHWWVCLFPRLRKPGPFYPLYATGGRPGLYFLPFFAGTAGASSRRATTPSLSTPASRMRPITSTTRP